MSTPYEPAGVLGVVSRGNAGINRLVLVRDLLAGCKTRQHNFTPLTVVLLTVGTRPGLVLVEGSGGG